MQTQARATRLVNVVCSGDHRVMGFIQGQTLRSKIFAAGTALERLESFRLEQPWWLPYAAFLRLSEWRAERALAGPLARDFPRIRERLDALAEGSGIRRGTVYLLNAVESLLSAVRDHCVVPPPGACSAVAVRGSRSATGEPIIAKNFDYLPLVQPFYTLRESRPADGLGSLDFTVAPLAGSVDGINEAGLCITNNYAFTVETSPATATVSMVIAEALEKCSTVTEAAEWIAARPRWGAGLLMMADASGDIASLELSSTRCRLRRPASGEDILFHTNAFSTTEMREVQVPWDSVFTDRAPVNLRGTRLHESAELRDARLLELLNRPGTYGPDELAALMADHGPNDEPGENTLCVHSDYWYTTACLQFFPAHRRLRVDFETACRANFQELEL